MDVGLVCDACSALTPIGVPQCARCGAAVALDPRPRKQSAPPPRKADGTPRGNPCPKCTMLVAAGQKFCPNCGMRMPLAADGDRGDSKNDKHEFDVSTRVGPIGAAAPIRQQPHQPSGPKPGRSTLFFGGAVQSARAKLTLIRGDGEDGVSFTLAGDEHPAGRGECPISFPDDPFLSPTHANFLYRTASGPGAAKELVVRDEKSLNGVYVRITGTADLRAGSTVLVGEQVLTVVPAQQPDDVPDSEGTYYSASMPRAAALEIRQNLRGGSTGWVYRLGSDTVTLGREGNDINFPEDPFISGRHAELRITNGMLSVTDLGSRNGTFIRVIGERVLKHGDYVFLGQQLLRVEIV